MAFEEFEEGEAPSRTALPQNLADELARRALDAGECVRLTLVRHQGLGPSKESLRPVEISGRLLWQLERQQGKQVTARNFAPGAEAEGVLAGLLAATGAREYHLTATSGDLHVRVTRKGRVLESRSKPAAARAAPAPHDREKDQPLTRFDSSALLRVIGLADGSGGIRASMRGKYDQINAFLRELDALLDSDARGGADAAVSAGADGDAAVPPREDGGFTIVDCGCGRAYLTLSAQAYLSQVRGMKVSVAGIDRNAAIIGRCAEMAEALGVSGDVRFIAEDLAAYRPDFSPDLVLSLHACDTATDLAMACGVRMRARYMLVAPCCQHDLQKQLGDGGPMRALLRHGILKERLADLLTDAFRAQLLRVAGYRVRVSEFVSPEATPRNIMLRAVRGIKAGQPQVVGEYLEMRDAWQVVPALEGLLGETVTRYFG